MATAGGLVFVAATNDSMFRAFDSKTGEMVWSARLDASGNATPISWQGRDGKQYVAIVAGGPAHLRNVGDTTNDSGDSLIAFALSKHAVVTRAAPMRPASVSGRVAAATVSGELPNGAGKDVVVRICGACHGTGTFANNRMSAAEWQKVVDDMAARGARGSAEEFHEVVDYLGTNLGRK
jgi:quinoprotein glucose dehydrogenase